MQKELAERKRIEEQEQVEASWLEVLCNNKTAFIPNFSSARVELLAATGDGKGVEKISAELACCPVRLATFGCLPDLVRLPGPIGRCSFAVSNYNRPPTI